MAKCHFSNKAVEDLSTIWIYTFDIWSEIQADLYYEMLINSCQEIEIVRILHGSMDWKNRS